MGKHNFQDEHIVRASLQRCLESSVVVPTNFWTEAPILPGVAYTPVPRSVGHALGIHGKNANIQGNVTSNLDVIDLTLCDRSTAVSNTCQWQSKCTTNPILPFSEKLWLFQERPPGADAATVVILPDSNPVTLRVIRRYAQSTPQYVSWLADPELAVPWCAAPTLQLLTSRLRQLQQK